jgi:hypothetical protein
VFKHINETSTVDICPHNLTAIEVDMQKFTVKKLVPPTQIVLAVKPLRTTVFISDCISDERDGRYLNLYNAVQSH